jgi:hypothetical protein
MPTHISRTSAKLQFPDDLTDASINNALARGAVPAKVLRGTNRLGSLWPWTVAYALVASIRLHRLGLSYEDCANAVGHQLHLAVKPNAKYLIAPGGEVISVETAGRSTIDEVLANYGPRAAVAIISIEDIVRGIAAGTARDIAEGRVVAEENLTDEEIRERIALLGKAKGSA